MLEEQYGNLLQFVAAADEAFFRMSIYHLLLAAAAYSTAAVAAPIDTEPAGAVGSSLVEEVEEEEGVVRHDLELLEVECCKLQNHHYQQG